MVVWAVPASVNSIDNKNKDFFIAVGFMVQLKYGEIKKLARGVFTVFY
jgi:hypothetical protein